MFWSGIAAWEGRRWDMFGADCPPVRPRVHSSLHVDADMERGLSGCCTVLWVHGAGRRAGGPIGARPGAARGSGNADYGGLKGAQPACCHATTGLLTSHAEPARAAVPTLTVAHLAARPPAATP